MKHIKSFKVQYPEDNKVGVGLNSILDGIDGAAIAVDSLGTIHCGIDNERSLGVCPGIDRFNKLEEYTGTCII